MDDRFSQEVARGIPDTLPELPPRDAGVDHAPPRKQVLSAVEKRQAIRNALRYIPKKWHAQLAAEFAEELESDGRIYMRRFRPTAYDMHARPLDQYPARSKQAAAIMFMITNNLDPAVAQHPYELITYGGNGAVFQNWAQYLMTMKYLSEMTDEQTLVMMSGHPLGLFPSHPEAPRVVVTNGMVIPNYSSREQYERMASLGVTMYGQMTAGSYMYIGPQGIVHGTTITLLNAGRKYLDLPAEANLSGKLFVTSGLGGMSGAQGKAGMITGAVTVIAEINPIAAKKRLQQGWVERLESNLDTVLKEAELARTADRPLSMAYLGNIVDLWERLVDAGIPVELGSDQTSLHNPFEGGYYPAQLSFENARICMKNDPAGFREMVHESIRRQFSAIRTMADAGMNFWDYGNAFLLEASRAGAEGVTRPDGRFVFPSYVEDIMGPMCFDYGFGPFRWACTSHRAADLEITDRIAADQIRTLISESPPEIHQQLRDNLLWIEQAGSHDLVVGSQARILYAHAEGRIRIALAFNRAIADGNVSAPVVLGRDHHDVGGTDSPFRETANIYDGSSKTADMAIQNVIGDAFRGATWVSIHNGGGVGWGEVINGGFGMLLDGSPQCETRIRQMLFWDVNNGIARRAWATNPGAVFTARQAMRMEPRLKVTLPIEVEDKDLD